SFASQHGFSFVDTFALFGDGATMEQRGLMLPDGVHLTDDGDMLGVSHLWKEMGFNADRGGQVLSFTAQSNKSYTVCYKNSPTDAAWIPLENVAPAVGVRAITVTDPYTGPKRFYRVVTPALP